MEKSVSRPAKRSKEAFCLAVVFWLIMVIATLLFFFQVWWLPPLASDRGDIDRLFTIILAVTGVAFVVVQSLAGFFIWFYSDRRGGQAMYWHESRPLEISWTIITALILSFLVFTGLQIWARVFDVPPENALMVEVTGQQFEWHIRYPGPDGIFGSTAPTLITMENPIGLDLSDPAAQDDVRLRNRLYLPVDQPVRIRLRSKDMLHSFFVPQFRVKQDAVPGMTIETWFVPTKRGTYELACAELCGLGHYRMRGVVEVVSQAEFQAHLAREAPTP